MLQLITKTGQSTVEVVGRLVIRQTVNDVCDPSAVKHSVRHSFDMPIQFNNKVSRIIKPLYERVVAEVICEERSWDEWARLICKATKDEQLRSYAASIAWWDFGLDFTGNALSDLVRPLPVGFDIPDKQLERVLRAIGYPTPKDRVQQLAVDKKGINRRLAKLGVTKAKLKGGK